MSAPETAPALDAAAEVTLAAALGAVVALGGGGAGIAVLIVEPTRAAEIAPGVMEGLDVKSVAVARSTVGGSGGMVIGIDGRSAVAVTDTAIASVAVEQRPSENPSLSRMLRLVLLPTVALGTGKAVLHPPSWLLQCVGVPLRRHLQEVTVGMKAKPSRRRRLASKPPLPLLTEHARMQRRHLMK